MNKKVEELKKNFCKNIKIERKNRHLTQKEVALAIGVTMQSYQAYEDGSACPSFDNFLKLSIFFDMPLNEFVE